MIHSRHADWRHSGTVRRPDPAGLTRDAARLARRAFVAAFAARVAECATAHARRTDRRALIRGTCVRRAVALLGGVALTCRWIADFAGVGLLVSTAVHADAVALLGYIAKPSGLATDGAGVPRAFSHAYGGAGGTLKHTDFTGIRPWAGQAALRRSCVAGSSVRCCRVDGLGVARSGVAGPEGCGGAPVGGAILVHLTRIGEGVEETCPLWRADTGRAVRLRVAFGVPYTPGYARFGIRFGAFRKYAATP